MTEQQPYDVIRKESGFEVRRYPEHVVAETVIRGGSFEDAGSRAFRYLFKYITGDNTASRSIEMTSPVLQSTSSKIAMTAPVIQQSGTDGFVVAFVLPATMTEKSAPVPNSSEVTLRTVPEALVAAARFSGRWSEASWESRRDALTKDVADAGLTPIGEPRFARFDPPYMPSFLRHNEVLVDVTEAG